MLSVLEPLHACSYTLSRVQLCDSADCSLPGSSVHGIPQARILEWLTFRPPGGLSRDPGMKP